MDCWMFSCLLNSLKVSNVKFIFAFEIIFMVAQTWQMSSWLHIPGDLLIVLLLFNNWKLTSICSSTSSVSTFISSIDVHMGTSTDVLMVCLHICIEYVRNADTAAIIFTVYKFNSFIQQFLYISYLYTGFLLFYILEIYLVIILQGSIQEM